MPDADVPQPSAPPVSPQRNATGAIWSLVLGIVAMVCAGIFAAIPAVICGHVARSAIRTSRGELGGQSLALAGLILGYVAIVLNLILIPIMVVPAFKKAWAERSDSSSTGFNKEIVSADGKERILAPSSWKSISDLNESASLGAGNKFQEEYLIVLSDNKADLVDFDLQKHHQLTRKSTVDNMKDGSATDPVSVTIDGHPALQDEISGTTDNVKIVFLHTTIDQGNYVHQILAWTLKSRWESKKARLQEVTRSFRSSH